MSSSPDRLVLESRCTCRTALRDLKFDRRCARQQKVKQQPEVVVAEGCSRIHYPNIHQLLGSELRELRTSKDQSYWSKFGNGL